VTGLGEHLCGFDVGPVIVDSYFRIGPDQKITENRNERAGCRRQKLFQSGSQSLIPPVALAPHADAPHLVAVAFACYLPGFALFIQFLRAALHQAAKRFRHGVPVECP
jgi:hypothetical protein